VNLDRIHSIYFIGIGGMGMSALARYFNANGRTISGYDRTPTSLTFELNREGMNIRYQEDVDAIPKDVDLVVYTPAIPDDHAELRYYREHHYPVVKRSDLLEALTRNLFTIAVAGTHGKTTTTSMIAHILKDSGYDCTAFLGGIAANYRSNFLIGKNKTVVVEADEYDRSFLKLHPDLAVITSCDADHLDVYGEVEEVVKAYGEFANQLKSGGQLITKPHLPFLTYYSRLNTLFYSVSDHTDFTAANLQLRQGTYVFDLTTPEYSIEEIHLSVAGLHNVENAVAAGAIAFRLNIDRHKIRSALRSFKGVKRRFEFVVRNKRVVYIDDYAHHPVEIRSFLKSVKEIFPDRKITCIFQPHLYTRTRDFAHEFGSALSLADEVMLLPIYPAREAPIEGVTAEMLLQTITAPQKELVEKEELISRLEAKKTEVLVTVGAGDIDQFAEPIARLLEKSV
jgi:UDP-N-acetylmuramate--alanine ligase